MEQAKQLEKAEQMAASAGKAAPALDAMTKMGAAAGVLPGAANGKPPMAQAA